MTGRGKAAQEVLSRDQAGKRLPVNATETGAPATAPRGSIDEICINTIRTLSIDAVQQAKSGHPGTPMALAPVVYTIWQKFLRFDPDDPIWPNRDRFVLSNGHASMLLYSLLYLTGVKAVNAAMNGSEGRRSHSKTSSGFGRSTANVPDTLSTTGLPASKPRRDLWAKAAP